MKKPAEYLNLTRKEEGYAIEKITYSRFFLGLIKKTIRLAWFKDLNEALQYLKERKCL